MHYEYNSSNTHESIDFRGTTSGEEQLLFSEQKKNKKTGQKEGKRLRETKKKNEIITQKEGKPCLKNPTNTKPFHINIKTTINTYSTWKKHLCTTRYKVKTRKPVYEVRCILESHKKKKKKRCTDSSEKMAKKKNKSHPFPHPYKPSEVVG